MEIKILPKEKSVVLYVPFTITVEETTYDGTIIDSITNVGGVGASEVEIQWADEEPTMAKKLKEQVIEAYMKSSLDEFTDIAEKMTGKAE